MPSDIVPDVFVQLCIWFHQDFAVIYDGSIEKAISAFVSSLDEQSRAELKSYISELLESGTSGNEFQEIWTKNGADFYFSSEKAAIYFFEKVRDSL